MSAVLTSTFAPTALTGCGSQKTVRAASGAPIKELSGDALQEWLLKGEARAAEGLGIDYLLVAQRWWDSGAEFEG